MRRFYNVFKNEKVAPLVPQLTWSHCLILIPIKDINEIYYYIVQVKKKKLTKRQLENIVKNKEYDRLDDKTIGIIICKKDNKYLIEYCSDKRIVSREYMLV